MATTKCHVVTLAFAVVIASLGPILVSADVQLSPDCPQAISGSSRSARNDTVLLKADSLANCTCLVFNGTDQGCAQWVRQDDANIGDCSASATLIFTATKNQSFTCVQMLNGLRGKSVQFRPIVIAGPTSVIIEANGQSRQSTFDLCPAGGSVSLMCQTPKGDDYEIPYFNLYYAREDSESISPFKTINPNEQGTTWSNSSLYKPTNAGSYRLKCRAVNAFFNDLYVESSPLILSVRAPPKVKPVITINDQDYKDGETYQVNDNGYTFASCSVTGGSPAVTSVTLTCGVNTVTVLGTTATLDRITTRRAMAGEKCTCSADHVTGCYNLTSSITLDVTYSPEVTIFTINGMETGPIVVEEGSNLTMDCSATGHPTPNMYITQETPTSTPLITVQNTKLNLVIVAQCDHTDMFYCVAGNNVSAGTQSSRQRSLQVYVKCAPQADDGNPSVYEATVGKNAEIRINVQAYPNPDKFILYTRKETVYTNLNTAVDTARYNVVYEPHVAPRGTVVVTLLNVKREDLDEYSLDITNGIKVGITYPFILIEASDTLSPGAIAGIAVGATAAVVIIVVIIAVVCVCKRRKRAKGEPDTLAGFDSFGKLGVENHGHYYSTTQLPVPNENPYQKPRMHQVGGYSVPKLDEYVDVQDHYDYIPADSVYTESTNGDSVAPTEVDYSGTITSKEGKSAYSTSMDNTYLPFNSSSGASDKTLLKTNIK